MRKLKSKDGSIIIGLMFFVVVIVSIFTFMFETGLLFLIKQRSEGVAKNISSSVILQIDEDYLYDYGKLKLKENKNEIANQILNKSQLNHQMFENAKIKILESEPEMGQIGIDTILTMKIKKKFVFYKDVNIKSNSKHQAFLEEKLWELDEENLNEMSLEDMLKLITIEEVF